MKIVLDERVKHRLIGMIVILSLVAIFAPAIMKKSSHNWDRDMSVHLQLPAKPAEPKVVAAKPAKVFQSVKVAHVKLPALKPAPEPEKQKPAETKLAKIEMPVIKEAAMDEEDAPIKPPPVKIAEKDVVKPAVIKPTIVKPTVNKSVPIKPVAIKPAQTKAQAVIKPVSKINPITYSVQLASFSKKENAEALVNRLKRKGYVARIAKVSGRNGDQYKVFVGKSTEKEKAIKLKNQLAMGLQLNGFVVSGVV